MLPARNPARNPDTQTRPQTESIWRVQPARRGRHLRYLRLSHGDPRFVDRIGARVYKYPPFARLALLLGLASALWALLLAASFALLSAI